MELVSCDCFKKKNGRFSTVPERGKPQRAEPELENRINESNMHDVYEPGHQGEREDLLWFVC